MLEVRVESAEKALVESTLQIHSQRMELYQAKHCRLGFFQDSDFASGHHRVACAAAGVLGKRVFAVESAANRVCREAGGRVVPNGLGERRVGILADGLPLFHGAQLAVDTLVAPRPHYADVDGVVLEEAKRRNVGTLNSQEGTAEHSWWSLRQRSAASGPEAKTRHEPRVLRMSARHAAAEALEVHPRLQFRAGFCFVFARTPRCVWVQTGRHQPRQT